MIISHANENKLYLVFQDFEDKIEDIYAELDKFPKNAASSIRKILDNNLFSRNILERQTNYIDSISTYIDDINYKDEVYYFYLFIIPKDIDIDFNGITDKEERIKKIEELLIKLFKLYSRYSSNQKVIELFENFKGNSFLQLEAEFYLKKLNKIYGTLLNYKRNYKNQIICSDKIIGEEIFELNVIEENPLKNYQFIKAPFQKDLIKFICSSLKFLKKKRLDIFEKNAQDEYKEILKILNKINNLLIKISTHKNISSDNISKKTLDKFFKKYKNNIEIKKNKKVFNLVQSIFFTELKKDVQLFLSVDLTKVFERVLEKKLSYYDEFLYIGNESEQKIVKSDGSKDQNINNINFLLEKGKTKLINQYPDFMINEENCFHIIDAKYKFKESVLKKSDDIRQVLVYSLLFNKDMFFAKNEDMKKIKKIILYVQKSNVNMNNFNDLVINIERIDIDNLLDSFSYKENLFNTEVIISPIQLLK